MNVPRFGIKLCTSCAEVILICICSIIQHVTPNVFSTNITYPTPPTLEYPTKYDDASFNPSWMFALGVFLRKSVLKLTSSPPTDAACILQSWWPLFPHTFTRGFTSTSSTNISCYKFRPKTPPPPKKSIIITFCLWKSQTFLISWEHYLILRAFTHTTQWQNFFSGENKRISKYKI